ncbi:MAG TPA: acyltransferase [Methylocella sp.]|jgi:maltose O-acetyltransferase
MSYQPYANKILDLRRRITFVVFKKLRIVIYKYISTAEVRGNPIIEQPLQAGGHGEIHFLGKVQIGYFPSPLFFSTYAYIEARTKRARIVIGDGTIINNGFSAIAEHTSITIGRRVLIGANVEIMDSNFHGLRVEDRLKSCAEWAEPVVIEDDVFIGSNVRVLKGVTIGRGAVVANGSVVVKDIPSGVVAGGNPARIIKALPV